MTDNRGLRLLLTTDSVGGVWQYSLDLALALGELGVETVLAHLGPAPSDDQRAAAQAIGSVTLIETGQPLDWLSDRPAPVLAAGEAVMRLARQQGIDLVQVNMPTLAAAAPPGVPVLAVAHGCVSSWWQQARPGEPLARQFRWHRSLTSEGLHAANRVVAPSAGYARTIARLYGLRHSPTVVHNGRHTLVAPSAPPLQDCVLTVGRLWDQVKGAALLDRVAAGLSVPFHAAGALRGPHGETARLDHLHAVGQVDTPALASLLAARPVFVSAATFEPFGLAVLEAAGAGCALVLADIAVFRELWDGVALFVPPGDEHAYREAIQLLIGDIVQRCALGDAAATRASRYTPARTAEAMLALYRQLLVEPTPRRKVAA
ncbi:glycosyltransferase family 4 protein [Sphingomonas sp. RS6]